MKNKTKRHMIIAILVFIVLMVLYGAFYYLLQKEIKKTQKTESSIFLLEKKNKEMLTQKKLIDETKQLSESLNNYFVYEERAPEFLEKIEAIDTLVGTNTTITSISTKTIDKETKHAELIVVLDSEGTYQQLFHFLERIENLPYEISIDTTSFARVAEAVNSSSVPEWKLSLTFSVVSFIPANQTL